MNFDNVFETAVRLSCKAERNVPMSMYTTFKIGGKASLMVTPVSDDALREILLACRKTGTKPFILGNGSNMLISDKGLDRVVINMCRPDGEIALSDENTIVCDAGVTLSKLCNFALEKGLTGLEFAFGIPGSAGGAAYMNAGAYGGEMKDVLVSCEHLDADGNFGCLCGEELALSYRSSAYEKNGFVITKLKLKLSPGNKDEIKAKMYDLLGRRKDKQPLEYPSAGSTFKRPDGYFAGALIEECGLKGACVGGAQVSEKHAGFVINTGGATSADVMSLIKHIRETVFREKGVLLEPEVRLIEN